MRAGGVQPDRDPPVRVELVHESGRTRVTRLFLDGRTIIRKEPLGPDADRRLRDERAMLERLRGVAGVAQLVETPHFPNSIMIADGGGTSLAGQGKPLGVDDYQGLSTGGRNPEQGLAALELDPYRDVALVYAVDAVWTSSRTVPKLGSLETCSR